MPKWSNTSPKRESYVSRKKIWERDKGICAKCLRQCVDNGNTPDGWEADHIIPVYEGGAGLGYNNVRTLCRMYCHKRVTATQAGARARELRQTKPIKEKVKRKWPKQKLKSRPFTNTKKSKRIAKDVNA